MNYKQACIDLEKATEVIAQLLQKDDVAQHIAMMRHNQACKDLEKATQALIKVLENEVEKGVVFARSLTEQVEANKQLKLKIDELQKQLEEKDNLLTQANKTLSFLKENYSSLTQTSQVTTATEFHLQLKQPVSPDGQNPFSPDPQGAPLSPDTKSSLASSNLQMLLTVPVCVIKEEKEDHDDNRKTELIQTAEGPPGLDHDYKTETPTSSTFKEDDIATMEIKDEGDSNLREYGHNDSSLTGVQISEPEKEKNSVETTRKTRCHNCSQLVLCSHTGEKIHPCSVCGKKFLSVGLLNRHQKIHTGEKPHQCSVCGKAFADKSNLTAHQKIHTGEKPHQCTTCGKSFINRKHLDLHYKTHTGEKPHQCTECGKAFSQKVTLQNHQRIHTGEKPHQCTECGKAFIHKVTLKNHQLTHTGEKPYQCTTCGKNFTCRSSLYLHKTIHTGAKPHQCSECGKTFRQRGHLKTHQRVHTKEKP